MNFLDPLLSIKDSLKFWDIINPDELGIHLRCGKLKRKLEPGIYWKLPIVDEIASIVATPQPLMLPDQSTTSKDGIPVAVGGLVTYSIENAYKTLYAVQDYDEMLGDISQTEILVAISELDWEDIHRHHYELADTICERIDTAAEHWGISILGFSFHMLTKHRCITLLNK